MARIESDLSMDENTHSDPLQDIARVFLKFGDSRWNGVGTQTPKSLEIDIVPEVRGRHGKKDS